jgi:hypothetical protein
MQKPELCSALATGANNALASGGRRCGSTAFKPPTSLRPITPLVKETEMTKTADYSQHEAMHAASVFALMVDNHLLGHPEVENNPEWKVLAKRAVDALWDLYQGIASVHIQDR